MTDAYTEALRRGLRSLNDPGEKEFRDFIFKASDSFRAALEKRDQPLDPAAAEREKEAFRKAVETVAGEYIRSRAQSPQPAKPQSATRDPAAAGHDQTGAERPYVAEEAAGLTEQYAKAHPVRALWARVAGVLTLVLLVAALALALASPLFTPVMEWGEAVNILLVGGVVAVLALIPNMIGSFRYGLSIALVFGLLFSGLSFAAHKVGAVRDFVEDEPYLLAMISDAAMETYFTISDWTGITRVKPGEPRLSVAERRRVFDEEVEAWLDK